VEDGPLLKSYIRRSLKSAYQNGTLGCHEAKITTYIMRLLIIYKNTDYFNMNAFTDYIFII